MSNEYKDWLEDMKFEEEQSNKKGMCIYCDYDSSRNMIYKDPLTNEWFLDIITDEWDNVAEERIHHREYINYCPYCGRKL